MEAIYSLVGVIVGAGITGFVTWRIYQTNRKDQFRTMAFEKRLETHQNAYYWFQKVNDCLARNKFLKLPDTIDQAQEWWYANCLWLDEKSRNEMIRFFYFARHYSPTKKNQDWDSIPSCAQAIITGIGYKYLPEYSPQTEKPKKSASVATKKTRK
jgi:hypothetical protein